MVILVLLGKIGRIGRKSLYPLILRSLNLKMRLKLSIGSSLGKEKRLKYLLRNSMVMISDNFISFICVLFKYI